LVSRHCGTMCAGGAIYCAHCPGPTLRRHYHRYYYRRHPGQRPHRCWQSARATDRCRRPPLPQGQTCSRSQRRPAKRPWCCCAAGRPTRAAAAARDRRSRSRKQGLAPRPPQPCSSRRHFHTARGRPPLQLHAHPRQSPPALPQRSPRSTQRACPLSSAAAVAPATPPWSSHQAPPPPNTHTHTNSTLERKETPTTAHAPHHVIFSLRLSFSLTVVRVCMTLYTFTGGWRPVTRA
jgi:hypothetical protein